MPRSDDLENAIREHRASKTPAFWSPADARLYSMLPEVPDAPPTVTPLGRLSQDKPPAA